MKTIAGSPARKAKFFKRPELRAAILKAVVNEEHLLISAPRRVGKTSLLLDLVDTPDPTFYAVFVDTEAIEESETFFKVVLQAILDADKIEDFRGFSTRERERLSSWANRIAEFKIGLVGLKLEKAEERSFYEQLTAFLADLKLEDKKILLMVDEFPITVENIQRKSGQEAALHFLAQNRAIRQNPKFQDKIKIIYTGSIGLFTAVKKIQGTDKINDLTELHIPPLNRVEATRLLRDLLSGEGFTHLPTEAVTAYAVEKLQWWIPFYFQLLVREISHLVEKDTVLTETVIDQAFENVVRNGNIYFEHFKARLHIVFKAPKQLQFVNTLLLKIKEAGWFSHAAAVNLANDSRYEALDELENILDVLKHDGYIVEQQQSYGFYSPILKAWWK